MEINTASRLNSLTMKKHVELLEILELPQLMESSIREEKYDDALELAAYVQKLRIKLGSIPIYNNVRLSNAMISKQLISIIKYHFRMSSKPLNRPGM